MTNKMFKQVSEKLGTYYGTSSSPITIDEWAAKEYYNACFCVLDASAKDFYSKLVNNFKFFPRVSEFKEIAELYRKGEKTHYENSDYCYCCMNTGTVSYIKKGLQPFSDYEYEYVSRCYCDAGKNKSGWPLCTSVVTQGEIEWLVSENFRKYGHVDKEQAHEAKEYITRFLKSF